MGAVSGANPASFPGRTHHNEKTMTAHSRFLSNVIALAAVMSASGCICVTTPTGINGDITFKWSFNGRTCMQSQELSQIVVRIPGQTLQNGGVYPCTTANVDGIKLLNFRPGTYNYTIEAMNTAGTVVFSVASKVAVNGDVTEVVDLKPTAGATGSAYIAWELPAGTSVTCQYLASIDITIDGASQPVPNTCSSGLYNPSAQTFQGFGVALAPGTHSILIDARDANGLYYYRKQGTFTVNVAETTQQLFTLEWLMGTVPLRWTFSNGTSTLTCQQAGVSEVRVIFRDVSGADLPAQLVPCMLSGFDGYTPYLYSGTFQVFLDAYGAGGVLYRSSTVAPPQVTAQAGVFPPLSNSVVPFLMAR